MTFFRFRSFGRLSGDEHRSDEPRGQSLEGQRPLQSLERPQLGPTIRLFVLGVVGPNTNDSFQRRRLEVGGQRRHHFGRLDDFVVGDGETPRTGDRRSFLVS